MFLKNISIPWRDRWYKKIEILLGVFHNSCNPSKRVLEVEFLKHPHTHTHIAVKFSITHTH